jgi:hypothetical protein
MQDGLDQPRDGELFGFDVYPQPKLAQSRRSNWPNGSEQYPIEARLGIAGVEAGDPSVPLRAGLPARLLTRPRRLG